MAHKNQNKPWHKHDKVTVFEGVFAELSRIQMDQRERYNRNVRCLKLYAAQDYNGIFPSAYSAGNALPENRLRYNVVSSCVDTICSKISKLKTKVTFLTAGGNWEARNKAKNLTKFMLGMFYHNDVWDLHQEGFKDSSIFDLGAIKHFRVKNRIISERVLPTELHFDLVDSVYGKPSVMYHVKNVDKAVLLEMFPGRKGIIQTSVVTPDPLNPSLLENSGQVTVVEAWKLPSIEGAEDGRHSICLSNGTLVDESWEYSKFPFTFFKWAKLPVGFYAQSLTDRLTGTQVEINKILRVIQRSFHLGSVYKVFLEYGSKVVKEQFNNEIGSFVYYAGTPPKIEVPKVVSEEMFRHLNWLIDKAYEETGISQLSAAAKKPSGLDSRPAMREFQDIETERFANVAQDYEESFLETAEWYIRLAQEIDADDEKLVVLAESKRFLEEINWKDVAIDGNEYVMQRFPSSLLPTTPAARIQKVQEMIESGMLEPDFAMLLLDVPDVEGYTSLKTAALETILTCIDRIVSKGKYMAPEPYMDLMTGIKLMQAAYNRGIVDELPEKRLSLIRKWISNADALASKAKAAATPAPPLPGAEGAVPPTTPGLPPAGGISPDQSVPI